MSDYLPIFLFAAIATAMAVSIIVIAHLIGPVKRTAVKEMPYESGMDPVHSARKRFPINFYLLAIEFLVFDVELLFLYPWAVVAYAECGCVLSQTPRCDRQHPTYAVERGCLVRMGSEYVLQQVVKLRGLRKGPLCLDGER